MDEQFILAKNDFIVSLSDGYDLRRNAAEYIIAWESLEKSPDNFYLHGLFDTANLIIKEPPPPPAFKDDIPTSGVMGPKNAFNPLQVRRLLGPGYLFGITPVHGEPTNHPWADRLGAISDADSNQRLAAWPSIDPNPSKSHVRLHPFHSSVYPLLRMNAVTGKPAFVEMIRSMVFGGINQEHKDMERDFTQELLNDDINHAYLHGIEGKKIGGYLYPNGSTGHHTHDLYERDFIRWRKDNEELEKQLMEDNTPHEDIEKMLRELHFENRADDWTSDKQVETSADNWDYSNWDEIPQDENHPHALGWGSWMFGLEWLSPPERTAVYNHMMHPEKGLDEHDSIKMPNGDEIPTARFIYNFKQRIMPELNWWIRNNMKGGRNVPLYQESNENDYHMGFDKHGLETLSTQAHEPFYSDGRSISDVVTNAIHDIEGIDTEDDEYEGPEMGGLPYLNLGETPGHENHEGLSKVTDFSFSKLANKSKSKHRKTRLSKEDLLFYAGYDKDGNLMQNHPIYGNLEGPIVPLEDINEVIDTSSKVGNVQSKAKNLRKVRTFLTAAFGPHRDEEKPGYWREDINGNSIGLGHFFDTPYRNRGGVGRSVASYFEFINSVLQDESGRSPLMQPGNGEFYEESDNNSVLGRHILPPRSPYGDVIEKVAYQDKQGNTKYKMVYDRIKSSLRGLFSIFNTNRLHRNSDGSIHNNRRGNKNDNQMESSFSPEYVHWVHNRNTDEAKAEVGSHLRPSNIAQSIVTDPTTKLSTESHYGRISNKDLQHKSYISHLLHTMLGRLHPNHQPSDKSVITPQDLMSGKHPFSTGVDIADFMSIMGWDNTPTISSRTVKRYIGNPDDAKNIKTLLDIQRHLDTNDPHAIEEYMKNADFQNHEEGFGDKVSQLNDFLESIRKDMVREMKRSAKTTTATGRFWGDINTSDAIKEALMFGGMQPSLEKERELQSQLESLESILMRSQEFMSPEETQELMIERDKLESQLLSMQDKVAGQTKVFDNDRYKQYSHGRELNTKIAEDRKLIMRAFNEKIKPAIEAEFPDAFNPENPNWIPNVSRGILDAQRYLLTVPHDAHGYTGYNYGLSESIKESPTRNLKGDPHGELASVIFSDGQEIDGNMGVEEVMDKLGLAHSDKGHHGRMKEHVRELIDKSNELNTPLHVSTINNLISNHGLQRLGGLDISHFSPDEELLNKPEDELSFDDMLMRRFHEEGYHSALELGQKAGDKTWKLHSLHNVPKHMKLLMNEKINGDALKQNGLSMMSNDIYMADGKGVGAKKAPTRRTQNLLDSFIVVDPRQLDPDTAFTSPEDATVKEASWSHGRPIGAPAPHITTISDTFDAGRVDGAYQDMMSADFGVEFGANGEPMVGQYTEPTPYFTIPKELLHMSFPQEVVDQALTNARPVQGMPAMARMDEQGNVMADDWRSVSTSEITPLINSLLNPDMLLSKSTDAEWLPPIRPMHRIFDLDNLEHLRGFTGSWVVSKWYPGKRVVIVKDENVTVYDENGKKIGVKKNIRESLDKLTDSNYTIDGILGDEELNIIDIMNYDDNNISDMHIHERLKVLRGQLDSHENVIIPGPHDTRFTDEEGLQDAVKNLQEEHDEILLRDTKSTYMQGERRHPKWLLLRSTKDYNFIILDRRGKGPYTYQLGAGPILDGEGLGNRAVELDGKTYMDVGTAHREKKIFKVGDIVRVSVTGISKKNRAKREVYNVQVSSIQGEGEGEGAASAESLDLLTKSLSPIIIPHDIEYNDGVFSVILKDIATVNYNVENIYGSVYYLHNPDTELIDMYKSNYPITLAESLRPYWGPLSPLLIEGHLMKFEDVEDAEPISRKRQEKQSAKILEADDENRLLKPNTKKGLELIERALDILAKERMSWTGAKGLGIDMATPDMSPRGPTSLRDESTLPDWDGRPRPGEELEKPYIREKKARKSRSNDEESSDLPEEKEEPTFTLPPDKV